MRTLTPILLLVTLVSSAQAGGQTTDAETRAKTIAPYLDSNTFAVIRFDLSQPPGDEMAFLISMTQHILTPKKDISFQGIIDLLGSLRRVGSTESFVLYSFADREPAPVFVVPLNEKTNAKTLTELATDIGLPWTMQAAQIGSSVVFGTEPAVQRHRTLKAEARPELVSALAAVNNSAGKCCIMMSPLARRAFEELIPVLPPELGGGSSTVMTRGVRWMAFGLSGQPKSSAHSVVQLAEDAFAEKVQAWMGTLGKTLLQAKGIWQEFRALAAAVSFVKEGGKLVGRLDGKEATAALKPLIEGVRFQADRKSVADKLQDLAKVMHMHNDHKKAFPTPASYDKQGKPLLSWRIFLLPYLNQEKLFAEFKLDEAWDSPHNKNLIAKMPVIYRHPVGKGVGEGKTSFVVPVGNDTVFPGGNGIRITDITDGPSLTIMLFEASDDHMVVWTKPDDWEFDPKQPRRGLFDNNRTSFQAALADASVRVIQNNIGADKLRAWFTRNAGD